MTPLIPIACSQGFLFSGAQVGIQHVTDGTSKTYLCGEKYLDPSLFFTDQETGNNETWCTGHNNDNFRTTADPPKQDQHGYEDGKYSAVPTAPFGTWPFATATSKP